MKTDDLQEFLRQLHEAGAHAAEQWLTQNRRSSAANGTTKDPSNLDPAKDASLMDPSSINATEVQA